MSDISKKFNNQVFLKKQIGDCLHSPLFIFLFAMAMAAVIFFARCPVGFMFPTLYAEDGIWSSLVFKNGFLFAVSHSRPDYYVFGNIAALWIGMQVCSLFYNNILELAKVYYIISLLFYAMVVSLPFLLLRKVLTIRHLIFLWLLLCFIPLGLTEQSGYEIIGRIDNIGYPFLFICFLLVVFRNTNVMSPWQYCLTDFLLATCVATNPICLFLIPAALWPYLNKCQKKINLIRTYSLKVSNIISLIILISTVCCVVLRILTNPQKARLFPCKHLTPSLIIEMGISRNIIYPIIHPIYSNMNNLLAVLVMIGLCFFIIRYCHYNSVNRNIYILGSTLLIITSIILIKMRPELRCAINNYTSTYVDRYYFSQNMIATVLVILMIKDLEEIINLRYSSLPLIIFSIYSFSPALWNPIFKISPTQFIPTEIGLFSDCVKLAAANQKDQNNDLEVTIFPTTSKWTIILPRKLVNASLTQEKTSLKN